MNETCALLINYGTPCGKPAHFAVVATCAAERKKVWLCAEHYDEMTERIAGDKDERKKEG